MFGFEHALLYPKSPPSAMGLLDSQLAILPAVIEAALFWPPPRIRSSSGSHRQVSLPPSCPAQNPCSVGEVVTFPLADIVLLPQDDKELAVLRFRAVRAYRPHCTCLIALL